MSDAAKKSTLQSLRNWGGTYSTYHCLHMAIALTCSHLHSDLLCQVFYADAF